MMGPTGAAERGKVGVVNGGRGGGKEARGDLWGKKGVTYGALNECPACRVGRARVIIAHQLGSKLRKF